VQAMIGFIDDHRKEYGVEPICRLLPIAPSTYHDHAAKDRDGAKVGAGKTGRSCEDRGEASVDHNFAKCGGNCCGKASLCLVVPWSD
jgi:hypothetical protein